MVHQLSIRIQLAALQINFGGEFRRFATASGSNNQETRIRAASKTTTVEVHVTLGKVNHGDSNFTNRELPYKTIMKHDFGSVT